MDLKPTQVTGSPSSSVLKESGKSEAIRTTSPVAKSNSPSQDKALFQRMSSQSTQSKTIPSLDDTQSKLTLSLSEAPISELQTMGRELRSLGVSALLSRSPSKSTTSGLALFHTASKQDQQQLELALFYQGKPNSEQLSIAKWSMPASQNGDIDSISDQDALQHLQNNGICACGDTANALANVYLGDKSEQANARQAAWIKQTRTIPTDKSVLEREGDTLLGMGPHALKHVLEKAEGPMHIRVNITGPSYSHAYTLETLSSQPTQGHMMQSFMGQHNMTEWAQHMGTQPLDLMEHAHQLHQMLTAPTPERGEEIYKKLFLLPGQTLSETNPSRDMPQMRVVFSATPFDPNKASETAQALWNKYNAP